MFPVCDIYVNVLCKGKMSDSTERDLRWKSIMEGVNRSVDGVLVPHFDVIRSRYAQLAAEIKKLVNENSNVFNDEIQRQLVVDMGDTADGPEYALPMRADERAGFEPVFGGFLFACLLKNIIPSVKHPEVDVYVLCQGFGYTEDEMWWRRGPRIDSDIDLLFQAVTQSEDFKSIPKSPNEGRHLRIFLWLGRRGHAFGGVWDVYTLGGVKKMDVREINTVRFDTFAITAMNRLSSFLRGLYYIDENNCTNGDITNGIVEASKDFPCLPFLTRSTLYIAMIEKLSDIEVLKKNADIITQSVTCDGGQGCYDTNKENDSIQPIGSELPECAAAKHLYTVFEYKMLLLSENVFRIRKQVLLYPPFAMNEKFFNISRFYLQSMGVRDGIPQRKYVFNGFANGFVCLDDDGNPMVNGDACRLSARFPAAISTLRECRLLICMLRRRLLLSGA